MEEATRKDIRPVPPSPCGSQINRNGMGNCRMYRRAQQRSALVAIIMLSGI
jgi:hypothetical protein